MQKSLRTAVIVLLSVGLLALFLRGAHLDVVWTEIRQANAWLIGLSAAVTVLTMVLRALRWQYLLEPIGHARFGPAFRTTTIGFAASAVLPARAGEVIRPYLLARQEGLSATATFATIIIERLLDAVTCVMLLASFVLFFDPGMDSADSRLYWLVEVGGVTVGALALVVLGVMFVAARDPEAVGRWAYKLEHLLPGKLTHKLAGALLKFAEGLAVVRTPKRLALALLLSFPLWLSIGLGIWAVTRAFGIDMPFTGSFLHDCAARRRRVGADARRRGRIRSGGADWADVVLRRPERSRGRRGAGAACGLAAADDRARVSVRAAGRSWIWRHAQSRARGGGR